MRGVGLSHEIHKIAEAETVLIVEGSRKVADKARRHSSAGVEGHITYKRMGMEPRKPCRVLRVVSGGGAKQGEA
jgi:hypothetical protein